jgi:hypothetical protein
MIMLQSNVITLLQDYEYSIVPIRIYSHFALIKCANRVYYSPPLSLTVFSTVYFNNLQDKF